MNWRILAVAALWSVASCHYRPAAVPLEGAHADLAALNGEWVGDYSSDQSARNGTILFRLIASRDSAYGDVLMMDARGRRNRNATTPDTGIAARPASQLLRIAFVRVSGARVTGAMAPYVDPGCDCTVHTTFVGLVGRNVVEGTYVTRGAGGYQQTGIWRVERRSRS